MTGPQLETKGEGLHTQGMAPKRLKGWLSTIPIDMQTIIDWVIQNFVDKVGDSAGGGGTGKITVQVGSTGDLTPGETTVANVDTITLDSRYFIIHDNGGGEVLISVVTTTCE